MKYDESIDAIEDIISKTYSKDLKWINVDPQSYQTIIFNYNFAYKAYMSTISKKGKSFDLLFVEKKLPDQHSDWEGVAEVYYPELIIIQSDMVLGVISGDSIKDDLIRLAGAIESNNQGMDSFFSIFK
jgi:hypothetical protein